MMKRKKILFVLHMPPPFHGSSVVGNNIFESKLINEGFKCTYINLGTSRTVNEIGKNYVAKIRRFYVLLNKFLIQIIANKPDLCYIAINAQGPAFYKDSIFAIFAKIFGVNLIYHFHNKGVSLRQNKIIDNFLYRLIFNKSKAILLSELLYFDIQKYFNKNQIRICPNGIADIESVEKLNDYRTYRFYENNNQIVNILFLSNLIQSKGVYVLLDACKILKDKKKSFKCSFVGGEGNITFNQLALKVKQLELEEFVTCFGQRIGIEKDCFFWDADVFVFPTCYETFGLVNLEAMQHFLPVISTFEGGIPNIIENNKTGLLVPSNDSQILAEKIEFLIENPNIRFEMGVAGRLKYEKEFTLKQFEQQLFNILQEIYEINE